MNTLITAHNDKMNRLVNVSSKRRVTELDFFTECSIKYKDYLNAPLALNPNESKNPWSNKDLFPEEEVVLFQKKVEQQEKQILDLRKEIKNLKKK